MGFADDTQLFYFLKYENRSYAIIKIDRDSKSISNYSRAHN